METKRCPRCKEWKPVSAFRDLMNGRYCKICAREYNLLYKYGISEKEYKEMYSKQNGKCKICGVDKDVLYVDHHHESGTVRGLLCNGCNRGVGFFSDNISTLRNALKYMESFFGNTE